jgi:hypothetical protein
MKKVLHNEVLDHLIEILYIIIQKLSQIVPVLLFGHGKTPQIISP